MKCFTIVMCNEDTFKYFHGCVPDDLKDDEIIRMCKEYHPDMFSKESAQELKSGGFELLAICNIDLLLNQPIVYLHYPAAVNETIEQALNIYLNDVLIPVLQKKGGD